MGQENVGEDKSSRKSVDASVPSFAIPEWTPYAGIKMHLTWGFASCIIYSTLWSCLRANEFDSSGTVPSFVLGKR